MEPDPGIVDTDPDLGRVDPELDPGSGDLEPDQGSGDTESNPARGGLITVKKKNLILVNFYSGSSTLLTNTF